MNLTIAMKHMCEVIKALESPLQMKVPQQQIINSSTDRMAPTTGHKHGKGTATEEGLQTVINNSAAT